MTKCKKCGKPIKENTDGDSKYCQGHSFILEREAERQQELTDHFMDLADEQELDRKFCVDGE